MDIENAKMHYEKGKQCLEVRKVLVGMNDIKETIKKAADEMRAAGDYLDAVQLAEEYDRLAIEEEEKEKEKLYQKAISRMKMDTADEVYAKLAKEELKQIPGYKDTEDKLKECDELINKLQRKAGIRKAMWGAVIALAAAACIAGAFFRENAIYQKKLEKAKAKEQAKAQVSEQIETETDVPIDTEAVTE